MNKVHYTVINCDYFNMYTELWQRPFYSAWNANSNNSYTNFIENIKLTTELGNTELSVHESDGVLGNLSWL